MGSFSVWHWVIVLVVVMMIFGTKKIRNFGGDLGSAVRGFKEGVTGHNEEKNERWQLETEGFEQKSPAR